LVHQVHRWILSKEPTPSKQTRRGQPLPGDDVRQIMWRFADRYELHMLVQARAAWRAGRSPGWSPPAAQFARVDARKRPACSSTSTRAASPPRFLDPEQGGFIAGPKNLALALIAFELAWVDAGAATGSLAGNLGLAPIHERGTPEQRAKYIAGAAPPQAGRKPQTGPRRVRAHRADAVRRRRNRHAGRQGARRGMEGRGEPMLQVDKRGRFITNMGFANVVTAAVDSGRSKNQGQLHGDSGGRRSRRLGPRHAHQKARPSAFLDQRSGFQLESVPASRIVGGYTVKDGVIIPNYSHGEIIEAVFRRTRVTVGLMTSAKLLSAVEPVILYQRRRFRGGEGAPGHAALRTGHPAEGGRAAPAGGHLGHGRGERVAGFCRRAAVRRTRPAGKAKRTNGSRRKN
jgi:hypothetical protein